MRRVGAVAVPAARGREYVELYFDPKGEESIVDRVVEEGYYLTRGNHGTEMDLASDAGTKLVELSLSSGGSPAGGGNYGNRTKHSPMAMVNSALKLLASESKDL